MNYIHYILTRFIFYESTKINVFNHRKTDSSTDEWVEGRFNVFEHFTLKSILKQKCKDFVWVFLTQKKYVKRLDNILKQYDFKYYILTIEYDYLKINKILNDAERKKVSTYDIPRDIFANFIKKYHTDKSKSIITTFLDDDDYYSENFIKNIQINAEEQTRTIFYLNYFQGLFYYIHNDTFYRYFYKKNMFASYIEPYSSDIRTIFKKPHSQICGKELININNHLDNWVHIIHNNNNLGSKIHRIMAKYADNVPYEFHHISSKYRIMNCQDCGDVEKISGTNI